MFMKNYGMISRIVLLVKDQEENTNIALYVATYITKDLINKQFEGYRIYGYSIKTLDKPIEEKMYTLESTDKLLKRYSKDYDEIL